MHNCCYTHHKFEAKYLDPKRGLAPAAPRGAKLNSFAFLAKKLLGIIVAVAVVGLA